MQISAVAFIAALPAQALAQCSPDPTQTGKSVICSGTDSDGITITTTNSPLNVAAGAKVNSSTASAITVAIPASASSYQRNAVITVDGTVSATSGAGINVQSGGLGTSAYDYYGTQAAITVNAGASVSGFFGIAAAQSPGNPNSSTQVSVDNAGTISGSSGVALISSSNYATFNSIINRATGTIGGIQGSATTITNDGTISGGAQGAIVGTNLTYATVTNKGTITSANGVGTIINYVGPIANSGTIANTGTGAAISALYLNLTNNAGGSITGKGSSVLSANLTSSLNLTNSGSITNTASGMALSGGSVNLTNNAGGVIGTGAGATVINAGDVLTLINAGTVTGNILAGVNGSPYAGSSVDSVNGTINGNLTFGAGNDTLAATLKGNSLYAGISGTINGGGGNNTVVVKATSNSTLSSTLTLPTNFSVLDLAPNSGVTLTLADGFTIPGKLSIGGTGMVDNQTTLSGSGQIIGASSIAGAPGASGTFKNSGTITSSNTGGATAVSLTLYTNLNNTGTISATGNAVTTSIASVNNSGTITAGGVAVSSNLSYGSFTNSGTINGGSMGLAASGGSVVNTGTIKSANIGMLLGTYTTFENRVGGVVTGGVTAIQANGFVVNVNNAGTINGNVNIANGSPYYQDYNPNRYYAMTGSVLNGNLTLGQGDILITDLANSGSGAFAGITGTVSANNSKLIYNVSGNARAGMAASAGFSSLTYQLLSGASLALTGNGAAGSPLYLAGTGTVSLDGSISVNNRIVLQTTPMVTPIGSGGATSALSLINNGAISVTHDSSLVYMNTAFQLLGNDSLVNNGSIAMIDTTGTNTANAAVQSAVGLTDSTIVGAGSITNNGKITTSGINAVGLSSQYGSNLVGRLVNSGQITSNLAAVMLNGASTIVNSGSLISTGAAAISALSFMNSTVTNLAGGTISGVGTAIQMSGGTITNAGTINGNVNFAYSPYGYISYSNGTYIANGGTLNGNLSFGNGDDLLVETGSGYGVTGTINGGLGTNSVGHQRSGTATVTLGGALPTNFSREFTVAAGASSRVTLTGPTAYTGNLYVGGDGTIVNQLATTGGVYSLGSGSISYAPYVSSELAGFVNRANVGLVNLITSVFDNSANIGSSSLNGSAAVLSTGSGLLFSNTGTIQNKGINPAVSLYSSSSTASSTIGNSGTINGGISAVVNAGPDRALNIVNSGTITGYTQTYYTLSPTPPYFIPTTTNLALTASAYGANNISVNNSGTITGDIGLTGAPVSLTNTGTITGNIATGTGNDTFSFSGNFAGALDGGAGNNTLTISGGNQSFSAISNIGNLVQLAGFASVSGVATLGSIGMTSGRLVGLAGSVINAPSISVGRFATFGSAGTVNGNIAVSGVLSPGASPGTMTVNGHVTLNSGSNSVFEITPTAADKLNINGRLVIISGSTLSIAATTPVKAGSTLNLISASGGVSGSYDTVTGLPGVVKVQPNGDLGLLVQFANPAGFNPQVQGAITYINKAMAAASAPAALTPALLALQDGNGAPIASAFARVTPEAYADAMQIGAETALSLAATTRMLGEGETSGPAHMFSFGQMMGSMRQFTGKPLDGINRATINGYGALGGIGVAGQGYALSAYVGWMDQNQSVGAIGASTQARGVVGGLALRLGDGATRFTLSASYDAARARTRRDVPDAGQIVGSYALPTVSLDASISHAFALSQGWQVRPQLGGTWVMTRHDALVESSAHPFALSVDQASRKQGFVDAGLGFESPAGAKGPWRRFLTLGMRYRVKSDPVGAVAALAGNGYGLVAYGVERDDFTATGALGVEYQVSPGAALFLNASGELGERGKRESAMVGLRWRM